MDAFSLLYFVWLHYSDTHRSLVCITEFQLFGLDTNVSYDLESFDLVFKESFSQMDLALFHVDGALES